MITWTGDPSDVFRLSYATSSSGPGWSLRRRYALRIRNLPKAPQALELDAASPRFYRLDKWVSSLVLLANSAGGPQNHAMESHNLLREVFKETSPKQIAEDMTSFPFPDLQMVPSTREDSSGTTNPLDRMASLIESTEDLRLIQWPSKAKNGFFVASPEKEKVISQNLMPATNLIVQEFADLLSVVACAATDNHVNEAEAARIRKRWEKLKTVTETFVHCWVKTVTSQRFKKKRKWWPALNPSEIGYYLSMQGAFEW